MLPTRVHAIVLVSKLHKPTMRALAYAKATRPNVLEAVTVDVDPDETERAARGVGRRADRRAAQGARTRRTARSPGRSSTTSARSATANPRDVVAVYIPEYVVGPLVGAGAAQPERAAAQGPAAVHAGRHGDLGALPAALLGGRRAARRARGRPGPGRRRPPRPVLSADQDRSGDLH